MSEYITVEPETTDDPNCMRLVTNLNLTPNGSESYPNRQEGDLGSPLAQTLFSIEALAALDIEDGTLTAWRDPDAEWTMLIEDISAALKDFFL
jgi:hypothetical protein